MKEGRRAKEMSLWRDKGGTEEDDTRRWRSR